MSILRRVLKLHFQGKKKLQISTATGLSRNTVKKYLTILNGMQTTWEEVSGHSDTYRRT
jgi:transposase